MSDSVNIETITLPHTPSGTCLFVSLYQDVQNADHLRQQLLAGNTSFEYAFIDASTIVSRRHVLAAAFRALNDDVYNRLKSRNVHSEIVLALSANNNIGEAFRRFGVSDTTTNLVVVKVSTHGSRVGGEEVQRHLNENVEGKVVVFSDESLRGMTDMDRIKKVYKIGMSPAAKRGKSGGPSAELVDGDGDGHRTTIADERKRVETQILGLMALRGAT